MPYGANMPIMHAALLLALTLAGNDDRDVIQTALLSFYKREIWHSPEWLPRQPIQLADQFRKDDGTSLEVALFKLEIMANTTLDRLKKEKKTQRDAEYLIYFASVSRELARIIPLAKQKGSFVPVRLGDFRDVTWKAGIQLVDRITRDYGSGPVSARASKPRYSPNGQIAWVQFSMPWSIHSADVQFVLEKREGQWQVRVGWARSYV